MEIKTKKKKKSKIIGSILPPAIKLWLKSQVEKIEDLEIKIDGGDTQILRGYIPEVFLSAKCAIYQGLYLSDVSVRGENIKINLGQVIKGKALRLLQPIFINGKIILKQKDIQNSLSSALLNSGLKDLFLLLLAQNKVDNPEEILAKYDITWHKVTLYEDKVTLEGNLSDSEDDISPIYLHTRLSLINSQILSLQPLQIEAKPEDLNFIFNDFQVDLGDEVKIQQLSLDETQLCCHGKITVQP